MVVSGYVEAVEQMAVVLSNTTSRQMNLSLYLNLKTEHVLYANARSLEEDITSGTWITTMKRVECVDSCVVDAIFNWASTRSSLLMIS